MQGCHCYDKWYQHIQWKEDYMFQQQTVRQFTGRRQLEFPLLQAANSAAETGHPSTYQLRNRMWYSQTCYCRDIPLQELQLFRVLSSGRKIRRGWTLHVMDNVAEQNDFLSLCIWFCNNTLKKVIISFTVV